jgi:hypothetical protein
MYCPRCGHQTISNELRFCSYCGFKLGVVKAALSECEEVSVTDAPQTTVLINQPRHRDINIGVILMFAGVLVAGFMAGRGFGREAGAAILAALYLAILVLSRPITKGVHKLLSWEDSDSNLSVSRMGMCFGATLMSIFTVVLAIGSLLMLGRMRTPPFLIGLALSFALLLILSRHIMRGLQYLIGGQSKASPSQSLGAPSQTAPLAAPLAVPGLPAPQGAPVPLFGTQRSTTAEIVAPPSITEHTTNLLETK